MLVAHPTPTPHPALLGLRYCSSATGIYATNLNKNRTFKIVSREKSVNFADFRQNNHIHTLSVAKKAQLKITAV